MQAGVPVTPAAATTGDEEPREGVKSWRVPGGAEAPPARFSLPVTFPEAQAMQASCMQAGTLRTVPSVGSQHDPQSQGQPRPESQLWEGGWGTPKTTAPTQ